MRTAVLVGAWLVACAGSPPEQVPGPDGHGGAAAAGGAGAGGAGAADAGSDAAGDAPPHWSEEAGPGCTDLVTHPTLEHPALQVSGGAARQLSGPVLWRAVVDLDGQTPALLAEEFSPAGGSPLSMRVNSVLPDGARLGDSGIAAVAMEGIVASVTWLAQTPNGPTYVDGLVFLDGQRFPPPADVPDAPPGFLELTAEPPARVLQLAWDGEAYAVNGFAVRSDGVSEAVVARVSPTGEVVLPFTPYGGIARGGSGEYLDRVSTDPESGITLQFGATGYALVLSGHRRDGSPLSCTGPTGVDFAPEGVVIDHPSFVSVVATPDGGWVSWLQPGEILVHRVDAEGCPVGVTHRVSTRPFDDDPSSADLHALWSSGEGFTLVASSARRLYWWDHDGTTLGPARILRGGDVESLFNDARITTVQISLTGRGDERWLTWNESAATYVLRTVLVRPGCIYPAVVY